MTRRSKSTLGAVSVSAVLQAAPAPVRTPVAGAVAVALLAFSGVHSGGVQAAPVGGQVVGGAATIQNSNAQTTLIQQSTQRAALNWTSFGIGAGESVVFQQPSASAVALNRVVGPDPSVIYGNLQANGQVFLINPSGVLFARGASVDVGGLVASTLNISNRDFMAGNLVFSGGSGAGAVVNHANIRAAKGGYVALLGNQVANTGTISANEGTVALGAGDSMQLDFHGDGLLTLKVDVAAAKAKLEHSGIIEADGGQVFLTARAKQALMSTAINVDGIITAKGLAQRNGKIFLDGGTSGVTSVSGTLDASSANAAQRGGEIRVLGEYVGLFGKAKLDASGAAGGGTVLVGGDFQGKNADVQNALRTYVGADVTINADAITNGDGGKVIVWADDWTKFYGSISARGGAEGGDGGFVEVSGKQNLTFSGLTDLSAPFGAGGTLLLDPRDITVVAGAAPNDTELVPPGDTQIRFADGGVNNDFQISNTALQASLAAADTTLQATRDINFSASVTVPAGGRSLTAQAGNNINVTTPLSTSGVITLSANDNGGATATGTGTVTVSAGSFVSSTGGGITITNNGSTAAIALAGNVSAGVNNLSLSSGGGGINQTAGTLTAATLTANTTGSVSLGQSANAITTLGASTGNGFSLVDGAGGLTVSGAVSAGTGALSITTTGDLTSNTSSTLSATTGINLGATRNISLNGAVGAGTTGPISIVADTDGAGGGTLTTTAGAAPIGNAGAGLVTLQGSDLILGASVAGGSVTLQPSTPPATIAVNDAAKNFNVSNAEIGQITTTGVLTIGSTSNTGGITVGTDGGVDAGNKNVELITAGTLAVDATAANGIMTTATLTFTADDMTLAGGTIQGSAVTLRPTTGARAIDLGTNSGGTLGLISAEINTVRTTGGTGTVTIGRNDGSASGTITVSGAINNANATTLVLRTGGSITQTTTGSIVETNLGLVAGTGVTMTNPGNNVSNLSGLVTGGGDFSYTDTDTFTVAGLAAVNATTTTGIQTTDGAVSLTANGGGTVNLGANLFTNNLGNSASLMITGPAVLTADVTIDTDSTAGGNAGNVTFSDTVNGDGGGTRTLAVDARETSAGAGAGGAVTFGGVVGSAVGTRLSALGVAGASVTFAGTNNVDTLAVALSGAGTAVAYTDADALVIGTVGGLPAGITTNNGSIDVRTIDGTLTVGPNAAVAAGTGNVALVSAETAEGTAADVALGADVTGATVRIVSADDITNSAGVLNATDLLLQAANAIGTTGARVQTNVSGVLAAKLTDAAAAGDIFISETAAGGDLTTGRVTDLAAANVDGITTTNNRSIDVRTGDGTLNIGTNGAVLANGTGNVTLVSAETAEGTTARTLLNADVTGATVRIVSADDIRYAAGTVSATDLLLQAQNGIGVSAAVQTNVSGVLAAKRTDNSTSGDILIIETAAGGDLTTGRVTDLAGANVDGIVTTNNGAIDVRTTNGTLNVGTNGAVLANGAGNVTLVSAETAEGATAHTLLNADVTGATVRIVSADDIRYAAGTVSATDLLLQAQNGIGVPAAVQTNVSGVLAAKRTDNSTSGNILIIETAAGGDLTTGRVTDLAGANVDGIVTTNNGAIDVRTTAGSLLVGPNGGVTADGSGDVTLNAAGLLAVNAGVSSGSGDLSLTGGTGVTHNAAGDLTTSGVGTIAVTATANDITMVNGTVYTTGSGAVTLQAAANAILGGISTTSSPVNVTATTGAITEVTTAETANITTSGTATLTAGTAIGAAAAADDIDTTVATVAASAGAGGVFITESDGASFSASPTGAGDIALTSTTGTLTVGANVVADTGNITLTADDMNLVGSVTQSTAAGARFVLLRNITAGRAIDLGTDTPGTLGLTDAELDQITAPTLRIGRNDANASGPITVTQNVSLSSAKVTTLHLITGSSITGTAAGIVVPALVLEAASANLMSGANDVITLAASISPAGNPFTYSGDANDVIVGTLDGITGITTNNGNVTVGTTDALTLESTILAGTATVTLNANSIVQSVGAGITADTLTGTAGTSATLNQNNAITDLAAFTTNGNFTLNDAGGLTLTGAVAAGNGAVSITTTGGALALQSNTISGIGGVTLQGDGVTSKGGTVTTTAGVNTGTASGDVQITANGTGAITLAGAVVTQGANNNGGTASAGGDVTFTTNNGPMSVSTVNARGGDGDTGNRTGGDAGTIAFNVGGGNTLTLNGDLVSRGGDASGSGASGSGRDLNISAPTVLGTDVQVITRRGGGTGAATAGNVTFAGTVESPATARRLTATTGGITTFQQAVGGNNNPLLSLTTDGQGTTAINGGAVTTATTQTYGDAVTVGANTTFTSNGVGPSGAITFAQTLESPTTARSVVVNTAGTTTLGGMAGGNGNALLSLETDAPGTTAINGGSVTTTTTQTYRDAVTLGANATLASSGAGAAGNITFAQTVESPTARSLAVNTPGTTVFGGAVGGNGNALLSIDTDAAGTTALNGGTINTTATQTYNDAVTLGANAVLTSSGAGAAGNVTFGQTVESPTTARSLTVTTGGTTTFQQGVGGDANPLLSLITDAAGTTAINGGAVTTTTTQIYGDAVTVGANTTFTSTGAGASGDITFAQTLESPTTARSIFVNTAGATTLGGAVGGGNALLSLETDAPGSTAINGGAVTTTTTQTYRDAVTLGANATLASSGAGNITFAQTLESPTARSLAVNTAGTTVFGGAVGGNGSALLWIETDAPGTTALNGGTVNTTTTQTYNDAVTLGANAALTSSGAGAAGNVTFAQTVESPTTARSLTVTTGGTTTFQQGVGGNANPLLSLNTDAAGSTAINGGAVTTTSTQTYGDAVTVGADTTFTSSGAGATGDITFAQTLESPTTARSVLVNTAGTTTLAGTVGGNGNALASLTTDAAGTTVINGGAVTTTSTQTYNDAVTLGANAIVASTGAGAITFQSTVNGASSLTANTAGATIFAAPVGGGTALSALTTDAGGTTALNGSTVTTSGNQNYGDAVTLGANDTLASAGGNISFANSINADAAANNRTLTLNAPAGTVTFSGNIGDTAPLADLDVTAGPATIVFNSPTAQSVDVSAGPGGNTASFNTAVVLSQNVTVDVDGANDNNVTFASTVNSDALANRTLAVTTGSGTATFANGVGTSQELGGFAVSGNQLVVSGDIRVNGGGAIDFSSLANMSFSPGALLDSDRTGGLTAGGNILFGATTRANPTAADATWTLDSNADGGGVAGNVRLGVIGDVTQLDILNIVGNTVTFAGPVNARQVFVTANRVETEGNGRVFATREFRGSTSESNAAISLRGLNSEGTFGLRNTPIEIDAPGLFFVFPNGSNTLSPVFLAGDPDNQPVYEFSNDPSRRPVFYNGAAPDSPSSRAALSAITQQLRQLLDEINQAGFAKENIRRQLLQGLILETGLSRPGIDEFVGEGVTGPNACNAIVTAGGTLACQ